eukprot:593429-Rhodomonas_salina.2
MYGTDVLYSAMRFAVLTSLCAVWCYALCCTDLAYGAMTSRLSSMSQQVTPPLQLRCFHL